MLPELEQFIDKNNMFSCYPDGCSLGVRCEKGPIYKPWRIVTTNQLLAETLDACKFVCPPKTHVKCEGGNRTEATAFYPPMMAEKIVRCLFPPTPAMPANPTEHFPIHGKSDAQLEAGLQSECLEALNRDEVECPDAEKRKSPLPPRVYHGETDYWAHMAELAAEEGLGLRDPHALFTVAAASSGRQELLETVKRLPKMAREPHREKCAGGMGLFPAMVTEAIHPADPRCQSAKARQAVDKERRGLLEETAWDQEHPMEKEEAKRQFPDAHFANLFSLGDQECGKPRP